MKKVLLSLFAVLALSACGPNKNDYILDKTAFCSGIEDEDDEKMICKDGNGELITGNIIKYYPNGKIHVNYSIKDGKLGGTTKTFYENGKKKKELNYAQGKLDGIAKAWSANGKIQSEHHYKDGKYHGIRKEYDANGKLHDVITYKNGKFDGERNTYSEKGINKQIYSQGTLVSDKTYTKNGKLISEYKNDGNIQTAYEYNDYEILVETAQYQNYKKISSEKTPKEQIAAECAKVINICQGESFKDIKKGCKTIGITGQVITKSKKGIQIDNLPNVIIKTNKDYKIGDIYEEPTTYIEYVTSHKYRTLRNLNVAVTVYEFKETDLPICK